MDPSILIHGIWTLGTDTKPTAITGILTRTGTYNISVKTEFGSLITVRAHTFTKYHGRSGLVACRVQPPLNWQPERPQSFPSFEREINNRQITVKPVLGGWQINIDDVPYSWTDSPSTVTALYEDTELPKPMLELDY